MFTGIVQARGRIAASRPAKEGVRLRIAAGGLDLSDVAIGDSIAVSGCCLTVIALNGQDFEVDVSRETLDCTSGFEVGREVNLEKALRLADRLGGHLVTGHVDGVGEVVRFESVGESRLLEIRVPPPLSRYIARKGSVSVDGVSLTLNTADGNVFAVNLIPHTLMVTTMNGLRVGSRVNIEVDLIARYAERLIARTDEE
ncbi:MAG TPA: riboflavin synthase [Burkholderiales bacterium]|nr:riboflavin synthase [Burkholderiales bacterium]